MTSITRRILDAEAVKAAYRDGDRNFRNCIITGSFADIDFSGIDFAGARLQNVRFEGITLSDLNFEQAVLSNVVFDQVALERGTFSRALCQGVVFQTNSTITDTCFNELEVDQSELRFEEVTLKEISFHRSKLRKLDFSKCKALQGLDFTLADLEGTKFRRKLLQKCTFLHAKIAGVDFSETIFEEVIFELAEFGTRPSWQKSLIFALPAIALATPLMLLTYNIFFWGWTATLPSLILGCWGILLASIPLLLAFNRQATSFKQASLDVSNFYAAKLHSANFYGASCRNADFSHVKTGISNPRLRSFAFIYTSLLITLVSIVLVIYLGTTFWGVLESLSTDDIGPNHSRFLAYIALVVVGFIYFLVNSLFRSLDYAILSLPITAIALLLLNFEQPIINGVVWLVAGFALFQTFRILVNLRLWLAIAIALALAALSLSALFQYDSISTENLITLRSLPIVLMVLVFTALRTGAAIAEVGLFTQWSFALVVFVSILLIFPMSLLFLLLGISSLFNYFSGITEFGLVTFTLLTAGAIYGGLVLGIYLGWQALRDRPEYRVMRDRGVFLAHWFGQFGTNFKSTRLANANFTGATLKNASFLNAQIDHVNWYGATYLVTSEFGRSYLRYPTVRKFVSQRQGLFVPKLHQAKELAKALKKLPRTYQSFFRSIIVSPPLTQFAHLDLRKIRLSYQSVHHADEPSANHINLSNVNFEGTDLRGADLRGANLRGANFSEAQLSKADLRNTELTNTCIRNWQIDESTRFDNAHCQQVFLDYQDPETQSLVPIALDQHQNALNHQVFRNLLLQVEDVQDIAELEQEFTKIDSIQNKIHREYKLNQYANRASEKYGIEGDRYREMFGYHLRSKRQSWRKKSWWQSILWFKIEPKIERFNQLTQELDIFPLLENLGRLSILVAVITFVNNALKPPDLNLEQYYRSWEIIHSDTEQVRGARRFALEQLRTAEGGLVGISASDQDLQDINLRGANLTGANLSKSNLSGATFSGAILEEANLTDAVLKNTQFGYRKNTRQNTSNPNAFLTPNFLRPSTSLRGADLSAADLTEANLAEVYLEKAILENALLVSSDLSQADLEGVNLRNANLTEAVATGTNFTQADLEGADLSNANFEKADLEESMLSSANLSGSNFVDASFTKADLQQANLTNALLNDADFQKSNLRGADLRRASISNSTHFLGALYDAETQVSSASAEMLAEAYEIGPRVDLTSANLTDADLRNANLTSAILEGALLSESDLTNAQLLRANISFADLFRVQAERADLSFATLRESDLSDSNLTNSNLRFADIAQALLKKVNLTEANLQNAKLMEADLSDANLAGANFSNADLTNALMVGADLSGADLTGANLTGADLTDVKGTAIYCNTTLPNGRITNINC